MTSGDVEELVARAAQPTVDALAAMEEGREPAVRALLADIRERFREPGYNVGELRLSLGENNRRFYDRFRAEVGLPPWGLVQQCRMELASRLLGGTEMSIAEVAFHVGYYSVAAFQRLCRSWCGLWPSRLRRRLVELRSLSSLLPKGALPEGALPESAFPESAFSWHFLMRCRRSQLSTDEVRRLAAYLEALYEDFGPVSRESPMAVWERTARERAHGRRGD